MYALFNAAAVVPLYCGKFAWANSLIDELLALADEKDARFWKAQGTVLEGLVFARTGEARAAITTIETGLAARRVVGATAVLPCYLCELASAYAETGNINEAGRCIVEAVKAM